MAMAESASFCRTESIAADEPLAGSAPEVSVWIALEYAGPWGAKAVAESALSDGVKHRLSALEDEVEGARVQLVRGDGTTSRPGTVALLLGVCELPRPALVRIDLASHDALLDLDVPGLVARLRAGEAITGAEVVERPVVLVCTNGKRDRCCAKWGAAVHAAMAARGDVQCWQTTHLGGHRFAATLVWLPEGLCYGRVTADEVDALVSAGLRGELYRRDRFRGRTSLPACGQAAEPAWLARIGSRSTRALVDVRCREDGVAEITGADGRVDEVAMRLVQSSATAIPSCGKPAGVVEGWLPIDDPVAPP